MDLPNRYWKVLELDVDFIFGMGLVRRCPGRFGYGNRIFGVPNKPIYSLLYSLILMPSIQIQNNICSDIATFNHREIDHVLHIFQLQQNHYRW
jgi:hypothetical protein